MTDTKSRANGIESVDDLDTIGRFGYYERSRTTSASESYCRPNYTLLWLYDFHMGAQ